MIYKFVFNLLYRYDTIVLRGEIMKKILIIILSIMLFGCQSLDKSSKISKSLEKKMVLNMKLI